MLNGGLDGRFFFMHNALRKDAGLIGTGSTGRRACKDSGASQCLLQECTVTLWQASEFVLNDPGVASSTKDYALSWFYCEVSGSCLQH